MTYLIDKSALVAELERIKKEECPIDTYEGRCKLFWFEQFLSFLNTLEVKEVDLEKEYKDFVEEDPVYNKLVNGIVGKAIAKHFFELGLKARKEE